MKQIKIVFDGKGPDKVFVEIEDIYGKSVSIGTWGDRPDGYIELVITDEELTATGEVADRLQGKK